MRLKQRGIVKLSSDHRRTRCVNIAGLFGILLRLTPRIVSLLAASVGIEKHSLASCRIGFTSGLGREDMHRSNSRRRRSIRAMATAMEGLESRRLLSAGGLIVHPNGGSDFETPHFSIDDVSHKEGDSGQTIYTFTITQTHNPLHQSDSLLVNTGDGTATVIDNDYEPIQGLTINFGPNDLVQQVSVSVNGDTRVEPDETFSLNLSDPQTTSGGFTPIIDDSQGVGTIENDDSPSAFSMSDVSHSEGNSGTTPFVFTLKRTSGLDRTDVVNYGSGDGTAEAPSDYLRRGGHAHVSPRAILADHHRQCERRHAGRDG